MHVADVLRQSRDEVCESWYESVTHHPDLSVIELSKSERIDHLPIVLDELIGRIARVSEDISPTAMEAALKHGRARYRQNYTIPEIVIESRILQQTLTAVLQGNLHDFDLHELIRDILQIGEVSNTLLEVSIRAYQSEIPTSLQNSFSLLYNSSQLGVVIASEQGIVDANDAFLEMIGFTREEMEAGLIDWQAMTLPEYRELDRNAMQQLREFGVCVPFEKEYLLRNGTKLPFMIGAVRLSEEPFQWAAYVVDLSQQRRALAAEREARDWQSKAEIVNNLAHEINNPLAAAMFTVHLLQTHAELSEEIKKLLSDAAQMIDRISRAVRSVLAAGMDSGERKAA